MQRRSVLGLFGSLIATGVVPAGAASSRVFRINVVADPAQMDPITLSEITAGRILKNMYEGFTDVQPDGSVKRMLAESWETFPDRQAFRFHLHQGVKFHSGRPFTAKDVKYTLEAILAPDSKAGLAAPYLDTIVGAADVKSGKTKTLAGVTVVDDATIDITFTKLDVLFPIYPIYYMDSGTVAEQGPDWMSKVSAGTGPFVYKSWTRGVSVDLGANPAYWGGAPKIAGLSFLIVPNGDTALSQYDVGELDFVDVYPETFRRVLANKRYASQLIKVPRAQVSYLGMNQNLYTPFKDKRVRQALSLVIDRPAMIKGLYGGAAFPANGFVTAGVPGYQAGLPPLKYDPALAKALMKQAGYPNGKGLPQIDVTTTATFKDEAAYFADQFQRQLGMPTKPKIVERATHIKAMNAGQVALFPWGWTADYPDAMTFLGEMWYGSSPYNRSRWESADFDRIIDQARSTVNDEQRYALYHRAEDILLADWGGIPLPTTAVLGLRKPYVKNATLTPFGFSSFQDVTLG